MNILNMKKESRNAIDLKWHNISVVKPCKLVCVCIYTRCLCYLVVTLLTTCTFVCISIGWHKKTSRVTTNMSENTDTIEKLVLSREDAPAPEIRRTVSTKMSTKMTLL